MGPGIAGQSGLKDTLKRLATINTDMTPYLFHNRWPNWIGEQMTEMKQKRDRSGKFASGVVKAKKAKTNKAKPKALDPDAGPMYKIAYRAGKRGNQAVVYLPKAYIGQVMKVEIAGKPIRYDKRAKKILGLD